MVPLWWAHPWAGGGWWAGAARALTAAALWAPLVSATGTACQTTSICCNEGGAQPP